MARAISEIEMIGGRITKNSAGSVVGVELRARQLIDAALKPLKDLPELQALSVEETRITGAGVVHLQRLVRLKTLYLSHTEDTDAALGFLQPLTQRTNLCR